MFRLPFKVYEAVITSKNKRNTIKRFIIEIFLWKLISTRNIKYNVIDFIPINKSIMAYNLPWTNLERFLGRIKSRLSLKSAKYIAR